MSRLLILVGALLVSACVAETVPMATPSYDAAAKSLSPPTADKAALYVYRPDRAGSLFTLTLDQRTLGTLPKQTFLRVDVPAGQSELRCTSSYNGSVSSLPIELAPGSISFVSARFEVATPLCRLARETNAVGASAILEQSRVLEVNGASN